MSKDRIESIVVGVGTLILGIALIVLGAMFLEENKVFTILMTISGSAFSVFSINYHSLANNKNKKYLQGVEFF